MTKPLAPHAAPILVKGIPMSMRSVMVGAFVACAAARPVAAQSCLVYVLERTDGHFSIRRQVMAEAEELAYASGTRFVSLILPWSVGQSGNVVQASAKPTTTVVRCASGTARVTVQRDGETPRALPEVGAASLAKYRIRASIFSRNGPPAVFVITPDGVVARDTVGPPTDMFRGMVPLNDGDVSITTEVREAEVARLASGSARLKRAGPYFVASFSIPEGPTGEAIVDLGASRTVLSRGMLPGSVTPQALVAEEHGPSGRRRIAGTVGALGGQVGNVSTALLPSLEIGTLRFDDARVNVLDSLPRIAGLTLGGVIGTDVLSRSNVTRLETTAVGAMLVMDAAGAQGTPALQLPFTQVGGLIVLNARAGGRAVPLILDTGARSTLISPSVARTLGLVSSGKNETFRGLDGQPIDAWRTTIPRLDFGAGHIDSLAASVAPIPVLEQIGLSEGGLLGQNLWEHFSALEVDWRLRVVRFYAR